MKFHDSCVVLIAGVLLAASVSAQGFKKTGGVMVNAAGMTLYTFDRDSGGKSACNGPCAANWSPATRAGRRQGFGRLDHDHAR